MVIQYEKRRKLLYKRAGISSILICIIGIGILSLFGRQFWIGPRCTTNFFHFNLDYRLGNEEAENTIIREPYYKLLKMYEKHPNWKFTIECQAAMIERIYGESDYEKIADLTDVLLKRGQMELICGIQYSQLFYTYPSDVLELNLKYAQETLDNYDLLEYQSNCLLFQEGQYGYGLATLLNSDYAKNIDTVLISHQQIVDFQPPGYLGSDFPIYELENTETDESIYLLQYDYFPKWEAGYLHSWNFLLDAELGFEDADAKKEFSVDDDKISAYEQEMLMLELEGNIFMTCSEWVKHCKKVDAITELDYYIPECNWGTTKYNSSYIWAANNGDSTDDGEMLANNYRCRNILKATREIFDEYKAILSDDEIDTIKDKFEKAELLWLQATATDSTGIGPDSIERITAEGNVLKAEEKCAKIIKIIADKVPKLDVDYIQVDLETNAIYTNVTDFIYLINITDTSLKLKDLPFNIVFTSRIDDGDELDPDVEVSLALFNSSDEDEKVFEVFRLDVIFEGTGDWADDSIQSIGIEFSFDDEDMSFKEIVYSPSLLEEETKRAYRYKYIYDPLYIFLPLSNGLLFIPDDYTGEKGTAIVKNVTSRHTSWLWEYNYIKVLETEGLHLDAHHQFYILKDVSLSKALDFANRINVNPTWIVSQNVTNIQGNEVYDLYADMENKNAEDEGSGEWW